MSEEGGWSPLELVRWTTAYFRGHGVETPRLDAEVLLSHVLGGLRIDLYLGFEKTVPEAARARYRDLIRRRAIDREPVAYLTGKREFWSQTLHVGPGALVPRPETEGVVEAVLELAPQRLLDVGTGCGAIACAVGLKLETVQVVALDRSLDALRVARENVERLGLEGRVHLVAADLLEPLGFRAGVIAANLPYVPTAELSSLPPEVHHEPSLALNGGVDGLEVVRRLIRDAPRHLEPGGAVVLEVGPGHAPTVGALLRSVGAIDVETRGDLAGMERVVVGRFGG
ncbi:MAG: peptide chain release factor N(5)-glutamine methyltransferase [Myxococcota bacterium]